MYSGLQLLNLYIIRTFSNNRARINISFLNTLKILENILWGEVGTRENYQSTCVEKPLNLLVREITGLYRAVANEAFSAFLSDHDLSQEQMTFVERIVDYVVTNGVLELGRLQEGPFRSVGSITQFPIDKSKKLVEAIRNII